MEDDGEDLEKIRQKQVKMQNDMKGKPSCLAAEGLELVEMAGFEPASQKDPSLCLHV